MKRVLRWALRVVLALIALVVILVALLHTPWGKSFVRGRIEAKLAAAVDGSVHLGGVDYGFLFSHIELKDLEIRDRNGKQAIAIGSLHVVANRRSLLRGAPEISDLAIDGVVVTMSQGADGRSSLAGLFKPSGSPPPASIHVAKLHVTGAATIARPDGTTFTITDLSIDGAASARPAAQIVDATLAGLTAKVAIAVPGSPVKQLDLALGPVAVKREGNAIDAKLERITFGALAIGEIRAQLDVVAGKLSGPQAITIAHGSIDHAKLQSLLGREVIAGDAAFDASLAGPPDKLGAHGVVTTGQAKLTLDGTADLSDPAKPRYQLTLTGKGAIADVMAKAPPKVPPIATEIRIGLDGRGVVPPDLDAEITLDLGKTMIGKLAVESVAARAHAHAGGITLESLVARGLGFEITASGDVASDTTLHGSVAVSGTPPETIKVLREAGIAVWYRVPPIPHLAVKLNARGKLAGELVLDVEPATIRIAGGTLAIAGHAVLDHEKLRDATTAIELHGLDIAALARMAGKPPPKLRGALSGHVALARTAQSQRARYDVVIAAREPAVAIELHGAADLAIADVRARVLRASDHAVLATATAHVAHDEAALLPQRGWRVVIDAPRRSFAELAELAPGMTLPEGDIALHAELTGTPAQPRGTIDATIHATTPAGSEEAIVHAAVAPGPRGIAVTATGSLGDLATLAATVALPSPFVGRRIDIKRVKAGASFEATITVPERELAKLPLIRPRLAALGGLFGGEVKAHGTLAAPALAATFGWHGFALAGGGTGATTLELAATPAHATMAIGYGPEGTKPVEITADVARGGGKLAVVAKVHAAKTPLAPLLPAGLVPEIHGADPGTLEADLTARVALIEHGLVLDDANLDGMLALRGGAFALPHGDRKWHGIELELAGDPQGIRISRLVAHETDEQVADRSLAVSGLVTIAKRRDATGALVMKPERGELTIALHDWLALGSGSPLFSDAPVASVNLDAAATADLAAPILAIDATVARADFSSPDRLDRSHQPEKAQISGDVIYLDETSAPAGTLPVSPPPAPPHHRLPLDIRVHIPAPIHALKAPIDLLARGELVITVRDTGVATRGKLEATGGELSLFGRVHPIAHGTLVFSDEHPHGELALAFVHPLPPEAMRELSRADEPARVAITAAPAKPTVALGGAFNSTLEEVLGMYHGGHPVFLAPPGLYPSSTAEVPRGDQFLVFGYISSALPHFLFLDRIATWADPSEPRGAYGQIRNLEADRYAADRSARVRVVGRPTAPGRSTAELQLDHLWVDTGRVLFGAGLRAGDRLGGGLGLFLEWSSAR